MKFLILVVAFLSLNFSIHAQFENIPELQIESRRDLIFNCFADVNQDGFDDILALSDFRVYYLENDGLGNFAADTVLIETTNMLHSIYVEDINADGVSDLILGFNNGLEIWQKTSGLNYNLASGIQQVQFLYSDSNYKQLKFADIDNDGLKDIIFSEGLTKVFTQDTSFNFVLQASLAMYNSVDIGDLNNDGWLDIVGGLSEDFAVALNNGMGGFPNIISGYGPNSSGLSGSNQSDVELIDFDLDGDLDVVQLLDDDNRIYLSTNNGFGVFSPGTLLTSSSADIRYLIKRDFNNDGMMDIAWRSEVYSTGSEFYAKLGNGVTFGPNYILNEAETYFNLDFSNNLGNGVDNMIYISGGNNVPLIQSIIAQNIGAGVYQDSEYPINRFLTRIHNIASKDINSDGLLDFLRAPMFHLNQGNNTFNSIQDSAFYYYNYPYAYGDLNNDGFIDVVGIGQWYGADKVGYWLGGANLSFSNFVQLSGISGLSETNTSIGVHDINNDGFLDIYFTTLDWSYDPVVVYAINNGSLSFSMNDFYNLDTELTNFEFAPNSIQLDNIDHILIGDSELIVKTNSTNGVHNLGMQVDFAKIADIDGDGLYDVFYGDDFTGGGFGWVKNEGNQVFTNQGYFSGGAYTIRPCIADVDNDGDNDILFADDSLYMLESFGYGDFSSPKALFVTNNFLYNQWHAIYAEDVDNDGDRDILFTIPFVPSGVEIDLFKLKNKLVGENEISGFAFIDLNSNQLMDSNEIRVPSLPIQLNSTATDYTNQDGKFFFGVEDGANEISLNTPQNWSLTTSSPTFNLVLSDTNSIEDSLFFGLIANALVYEVTPELVGGFPRCNTLMNMWISASNHGTSTVSGVLELNLDESITFVSSQVLPDSIVGNSIFWSYDSLNPFGFNYHNITVQMPSFLSMGDELISSLTNYTYDSSNNLVQTSADTLSQILVCAYDPNDKTVEPAGLTEFGYITNDQTLEYLVRFQNTGNDTAVNVKLIDKIHQNLDITSFELLAFSHPVNVSIQSNENLIFEFNNIMLPDSNVNFLGSQGFVKFKINLKPGLVEGDEIVNRANIYFDANPAVITNLTLNTIFDCNGLYNLSNLPNMAFCSGDTVSIGSIAPLLDNVDWLLNNNYLSSGSDASFITNYPNDTLLFQGSNDFCSVDTAIIIFVIPDVTPNLQLPEIVEVCNDAPFTLTSNFPSGNIWYLNNNYLTGGPIYNATVSGTYTLVHTYAGCYGEDQVTINFLPEPIPNIIGQGSTLVLCEGESVLLSSQHSINNSWYLNGTLISNFQNILVNQPGTYQLNTWSEDCPNSVSNFDSILVFNTNTNASINVIDESTVESAFTYTAYYWLDCDNSMSYIPGEFSQVFNTETPGHYALQVIDDNGCVDTSDCFSLNITGLLELSNEIQIVPNPTTDYLRIIGLNKLENVRIYNTLGEIVIQTQTNEMIDLSGVQSGTYFVQIETDLSSVVRKIVVVNGD